MSYSKPITFKMKNFAELGVRLFDCLDENHFRHPNIEDKDAKLFSIDEVYREMRLKILVCFFIVIIIHRGTNLCILVAWLFRVSIHTTDQYTQGRNDEDIYAFQHCDCYCRFCQESSGKHAEVGDHLTLLTRLFRVIVIALVNVVWRCGN